MLKEKICSKPLTLKFYTGDCFHWNDLHDLEELMLSLFRVVD